MQHRYFITPLLLPLSCYLAGVMLQLHWPCTSTLLVSFFTCTILSTIAARHYTQSTHTTISIAFLSLICGALLCTLQMESFHEQLLHLAQCKRSYTGIVIDHSHKKNGMHRYTVALTTITPAPSSIPWTTQYLTYSSHKPLNIAISDQITINNLTVEATSRNNPFFLYQCKERIVGTVFASPHHAFTITPMPTTWRRWLHTMRNDVLTRITKKCSSTTRALYALIFLGNKEYTLWSSQENLFNYWGITHYLARSGLHIVLFIAIWLWILRWIPMHIFLKRLLLLVLTLLYLAFSWLSLAFNRSYCMFVLAQAAYFLYKTPNTLHLITLTCFGMVIYNPALCSFLDFQLTFGLTFALLLINTLRQ